jgi:predicted nucleic acid-binding Zn ribbon protein
MSGVRKNINCKVCGNPNPKGKHVCSDVCARTYSFNKSKLKREATKHLRPLINGISKIDEIKYYKGLIDTVSSYIELRKADTMKHKRSYAWIIKYCKPKWIYQHLNVWK